MGRSDVGGALVTAFAKSSDVFADDVSRKAFQRVAFQSLETSLQQSDSASAKALFEGIDSTVKSNILGDGFESTQALQALFRRVASEQPQVFDNTLVRIAKSDNPAFQRIVGGMDDVALRRYYNALGDDAVSATLKDSLEQAAEATGRSADFFGSAGGRGAADTEVKVVITNAAAQAGVDTTDNAATKSWLKGVLGVGKAGVAVAPAAIAIYYFMNIAHAITGMSYLDLAAALLNPASLFDSADGGGNGDDNGDGSGILSTLGMVMVGLMAVVGVTFVVRIFKMVTG